MREITQTKFPPYGDCYAACIASIFELPIESLPHLPEGDEGDAIIRAQYPDAKEGEYLTIKDLRNSFWSDMWAKWRTVNNLISVRIPYTAITKWDRNAFACWHILSGISPRDKEEGQMLHSVVGKQARIWFDPHPSRAGLLSIDDIELIVPFDPAKPILQNSRSK